MKTIRIVVFFAILVFHNVCLSQNLVPNGDFENDFTGWTTAGVVNISSSVVHSGAKSFMASDTLKNRYSEVYQEFSLDYDTHEINFWVYPASTTYFSAFELIANWQTSPPVIFVTRVLLQENSISFTAVDRNETISNILTPNSWNKVTIQVDKATLNQDFFINDNLVSTLTPSSFPTIEHLLVGDLSIPSMYGTIYFDGISIMDSHTTSVDEQTSIPSDFVLGQNYPNPFNPTTTIAYQTVEAGLVVLKIYNTSGQEVKTLVNKMQLPGNYSIKWDGTNKDGRRISSALYLYRLNVNGSVKTRKMLAIK